MKAWLVAAFALGVLHITGCTSRADELLEQLESDDPAKRRDAIRGLVRLRYGDRVLDLNLPQPGEGPVALRGDEPKIIRALTRVIRDDPDHHVRYQAALAMGHLRPPGRNDALLDCAANDLRAGHMCATALLAVADPANLEDMVGMLGPDRRAGRNTINVDIGKVGPTVLPYLAELVRQDREDVARPAIYALADVGTPEAYWVIADALRSPRSLHRYAAIASLAEAGPAYRPLIERYLTDPSDGVRAMAARVLGIPEPPTPPVPDLGPPPGVDAGAGPSPAKELP